MNSLIAGLAILCGLSTADVPTHGSLGSLPTAVRGVEMIDVESFDPATLHTLCGPKAVACHRPEPTPQHPHRWLVAYSNDYNGAEAACIVARETAAIRR